MSARSRKGGSQEDDDAHDDDSDIPRDEWLRGEGPDEDVVVCTRVRLARNLEGHEFSIMQTDEQAAALTAEVTEALGPLARQEEWKWFDIRALSALERRCLVERHLISRELEEADRARGVMFDPAGRSSVMINEEDHLRIQVFRSGLRMQEAYQSADSIDDAISNRVGYAWSNQFGYLTSCPTNTGTGMRISVLMHLPALVTAKEIEKATNAIHEMNMTVRGLFGEGSQDVGDLFQISNQKTLGSSEDEILDNLSSAVRSLITFERRQRQEFMSNRVFVEDRAWRAVGILERARSLSSEETMNLLSRIRLGAVLSLVDGPTFDQMNRIFLLTQPGHLQSRAGQQLDPRQRDEFRARLVRDILGT